MKAKVIENICIGCGACQAVAPEVFEINDNGVSECTKTLIPEEEYENVREAQQNCPTNAIDIEEE